MHESTHHSCSICWIKFTGYWIRVSYGGDWYRAWTCLKNVPISVGSESKLRFRNKIWSYQSFWDTNTNCTNSQVHSSFFIVYLGNRVTVVLMLMFHCIQRPNFTKLAPIMLVPLLVCSLLVQRYLPDLLLPFWKPQFFSSSTRVCYHCYHYVLSSPGIVSFYFKDKPYHTGWVSFLCQHKDIIHWMSSRGIPPPGMTQSNNMIIGKSTWSEMGNYGDTLVWALVCATTGCLKSGCEWARKNLICVCPSTWHYPPELTMLVKHHKRWQEDSSGIGGIRGLGAILVN